MDDIALQSEANSSLRLRGDGLSVLRRKNRRTQSGFPVQLGFRWVLVEVSCRTDGE